jgi:predicted adenine nucleotide alpha hydrolase (AANH) superfamily ATPase
MKTLLHACCGPCLGGSYPLLEAKVGKENIAVFWENPNIHPYFEYVQRLNTLATVAEHLSLKIFWGSTEYGLESFLKVLNGKYDNSRCFKCYELRLEATAKRAKQEGFDAFSTTLLISPYQDHELIRSVGEALANCHGIAFNYLDFREGFRKTHDLVRDLDLYKQKYCGCIFSEYQRYAQDKKLLKTLERALDK